MQWANMTGAFRNLLEFHHVVSFNSGLSPIGETLRHLPAVESYGDRLACGRFELACSDADSIGQYSCFLCGDGGGCVPVFEQDHQQKAIEDLLHFRDFGERTPGLSALEDPATRNIPCSERIKLCACDAAQPRGQPITRDDTLSIGFMTNGSSPSSVQYDIATPWAA